MIPTNYEKCSNKIIFPAYLQPKLDGFRMYALYIDGELNLLSRQNKQIFNIDHLKGNINKFLKKNENYILDGELIADGLTLHNLKSILSKKNSKNDKNELEKIKYNVF